MCLTPFLLLVGARVKSTMVNRPMRASNTLYRRLYTIFYAMPLKIHVRLLYPLLLQIAVESRLAHSKPPPFAHKYQRKDRQRDGKVDKGKGDPGVLEANLCAQLYCVEADAEAKNLTAKV